MSEEIKIYKDGQWIDAPPGTERIVCKADEYFDVADEIWMHSVEEKIPSCCTHRIIDADEAIELLGYERCENWWKI